MHNVDIQTDNLIHAIRESEAYIHYQRAQEALMQKPELNQLVNEFRKRKFFMQLQKNENFLQESEILCKEYDELLHNELVEEFLEAEQKLSKMMRQVSNRIFGCIDMDIDFLEE